MDPVIVVKEGRISRKFTCPFCGYVHVFSPKGKSSFKKRVIGFTCPGCGKKPTEADFNRKKGRGPKPKEERRKRVKKEVVKEIPAFVVHPYVEQFEWKTIDPLPPGEHRNRRYGTNGVRAKRWKPKPPQPTERTLEEALVEGFLSNPKRKHKK